MCFPGKFSFLRLENFVLGENVRPTYISAFIFKGCPFSVGLKGWPKGC